MEDALTENQLKGIHQIIALKDEFASGNLHWLNEMNITVSYEQVTYSNIMDTFINTFCTYDLPDSDYMSIHLEANQYKMGKALFADTTVPKILKHLTYIIWTDKLADGYLPARVKDQTIYNILCKLAELEPLILKSTAA